ncbi:MAG: molybdenum ABC transporter ATP-binding protein [Acidobacteriota bacterium]|nr:molybdenum ABC transporter ATP-binding protein [Acidobacteriota bacterium]
MTRSPSPETSSLLSVALRKRLSAGRPDGFLLDVGFSVPPGITIVFGPSGSGKTTMFRCISGLVRPDSGRIAAGDHVFFDSEARVDESVGRRSIGYLFQSLALFPHLNVEANVRYGLSKLDERERSERTEEILESFRIAHLRTRLPGEISGGERQRVALARSLVLRPRVLLLDEPLTALDAPTKSRIIADLRVWNDRRRVPILYATHSHAEVFALGEQAIVLEAGKILSFGTPQEVLVAPAQETLAQLAGFENIFDAVVTERHDALGTMTCRLKDGPVDLEVPLTRLAAGAPVGVAIRSGDVLLAAGPPGLVSARNVIAGHIRSVSQSGVTVAVVVDCGVDVQATVTPAARDAMRLAPGSEVWLIIKTYSCHLVR